MLPALPRAGRRGLPTLTSSLYDVGCVRTDVVTHQLLMSVKITPCQECHRVSLFMNTPCPNPQPSSIG